MSETRYGQIYPPDAAWLAKATPEEILEPELPIIDTHHHLWVRDDQRYLLHELIINAFRYEAPPISGDTQDRTTSDLARCR